MKSKKTVFILMIFIFLFTVSSAYASDVADDAIASDDAGIELTTTENDVKTIENEQTFNETDNKEILSASDEDETLVSENDLDVLSYSYSTYVGLSEEIGSGGNIELAHDYYIFSGNPDTISITVPGVIDGKGAIIDMNGSDIQTFSVKADGVTFKNLTIMNAHYKYAYSAAIYFEQSGELINCNFINNSAPGGYIYGCRGGAVHFDNDGIVTNCNFENNYGGYGGAICFEKSATVKNCNFYNNTAEEFGGAVYFGDSGICTFENCNFTNNQAVSMSGGAIILNRGNVTNCNFNNTRGRFGSAIFIRDHGNVTNCNFNDAVAYEDGGAIYFEVNGTVENCSFNNCKGLEGFYGPRGGAIWFTSSGSLINCNFTDCMAKQGGAVYFYADGNVTNCNFDNMSVSGDGSAIMCDGDCTLTNCNFTNGKVTYGHGGAVYIVKNGVVTDCNFINNRLNQYATAGYAKGGAIYMDSGNVENSNFINNKATATESYGGAIYFNTYGNVANCNFTNNIASSQGGAVYFDLDGEVENCNFVGNNATATGSSGGAVHIDNYGEVTNCNFTNNVANEGNGSAIMIYSGFTENCIFTNNTGSRGAVYFYWRGDVINSQFIKNTASVDGGAIWLSAGDVENSNFVDNEASGYGGAILCDGDGTVTNCNFSGNKVNEIQGYGGAIYWNATNSNVFGCSFVNNSGERGGAVYIYSDSVKNCNFTNNVATEMGGAVWISSGNVENCDFNNNVASYGTVYFDAEGNVTNCNFVYNTAYSNSINSGGGAIYFKSIGDVANCNFTNNIAYNDGGAIYFEHNGNVANCSFVNNTAASYGGAVHIYTNATVTNCNFTNNTVDYSGGALYIGFIGEVTGCNFVNNSVTPLNYGEGGGISMYAGTVDNSNFFGNKASEGSAIYFDFLTTRYKSVSNSILLNNRAFIQYITPFKIDRNGNRIQITFEGRDNHLNAIYASDTPISFTNVTYWGANGITNTGESTIAPKGSHKEAGQNLTAIVYVDDILIFNGTKVTNENGEIFLDFAAGNYKVTVRHDSDSYYTGAEKTATFKTSGTKTSLNLSASGYIVKATLTPNIANAKILFIVKNESGVVKTVESPVNDEGIAELNVTGLSEGEYEIVATYRGNSKNCPSQSNMTYELVKLDPTVLIVTENITTDKAEIINITVNNVTDKIVTVYFNKERYTVNNGTLTLTGLDEGLYSARAIWGGDDYYRVGSDTAIFWVIRNIEYYANVTAMTYIGKTANITAKSNIPNNIIEGKLVFTLPNGTEISANFSDDRTWWAIYRFDDYGDYNVTASYSGLDGVTINNATLSFRNPITISDMSSFYGDVVNVVADVHESFNGQNMTISVNETSKNVTVINGKAEANFTNLSAGEYVIAVNYSGEIYDPANATAKLTVNKINSTLEIDDVILDYGESAIVTAITEGATGITAKIDDVDASFINYVILIPNGLEVGNHTLTVTTIPDESHYSINKTATITINDNRPVKKNTTISLNVSSVENYVTFTVSVIPDATGFVKFQIIGSEEYTYYSEIENGMAISHNVLAEGEYYVIATYEGDNYFNSNVTDENFTVTGHKKMNITINCDVASDVTYGDDVIVEVTGSANGDYTVTINDVTKYVALVVGEAASVNFGALNAGTYEVVASYPGDDNYNKASANATLKVNKAVPEITVFADPITYGEVLVVNVVVTGDISKSPTVTIGNESKTVTLEECMGTVEFSGLTAGTYDITVSYSGDDNYDNTSVNSIAKVERANPEIKVYTDSVAYGEDVIVVIQLPGDVARRAIVEIEGESKIVSLIDGVGTAKFSGLVAGTHNITVSYNGDANYVKTSVDAIVKVKRVNPEIKVYTDSVAYGEDVIVVIQLPGDVARRAIVNLGNESKLVSLTDGVGYVKFSGLAVGNYAVTVSYEGDVNYGKSYVNTNVNVYRSPVPIMVIANPVSYGEDVVIDVQLPSDVTRRVNITVGNVSKLVSLKNGVGSLKVSGLDVGTYDVTVLYNSDYNYLKNSVLTTVKVNRATPEIQVTANNITSGEALVVDVQLPGDVTKRANVTIGNQSKLVSLRNGFGSIKFTGLEVGTHDVVVSYVGDVHYTKASTTTIIEVK